MSKGAGRAGWASERLGDVTTKIGSGATPLGGEEAYKESGVCLIRSLNVHDWGFRETKLAHIDDVQAAHLSYVEIEANDVLLNITGASVARCCLAPPEVLPARVNQHVSIVRPVQERLSPAFLHYLLISNTYKDRLLQAGEGGGSTRQAITKAQIQEFRIQFPESLPEQQRIVGIRAIHPERNIASRFLLFALRTGINHSENVLSNAAHGTLKIDMDALSSVAIPVPSRFEQERVVRQIDALDAETQRLESLYRQKLAALDALKKSILDRAFSGLL
jgi:type I restriction enzyme S subunit